MCWTRCSRSRSNPWRCPSGLIAAIAKSPRPRRDGALIGELGLRLPLTLETHVHAAHVTAARLLKQRLGSRIALAQASGAKSADLALTRGGRVAFGSRYLEMRETPGHTLWHGKFNRQ